MSDMPRVSFGSRVVQKLKRVSLNHNLLANLQVKEGDTIDLYFDTDEQTIVIKKSNVNSAKTDK
jgi:ribosomal 50S subunit-recycling heat shock protein